MFFSYSSDIMLILYDHEIFTKMFWDLFFHKQGIKQMQLDKFIYNEPVWHVANNLNLVRFCSTLASNCCKSSRAMSCVKGELKIQLWYGLSSDRI